MSEPRELYHDDMTWVPKKYYIKLQDELDKEQENHLFYKREWESCCERYDYAREELEQAKANLKEASNAITAYSSALHKSQEKISKMDEALDRECDIADQKYSDAIEGYRAKLLNLTRNADRALAAHKMWRDGKFHDDSMVLIHLEKLGESLEEARAALSEEK